MGGAAFCPFPPAPGRLKARWWMELLSPLLPARPRTRPGILVRLKVIGEWPLYFAQPPPPQPFSSGVDPARLRLGTSVGGALAPQKGLMLGAERRRKEGRKRCPVPGKATKQKMNQEGGRPGLGAGGQEAKTQGLLSRGPGCSALP